jgi:hypothetical protein
MLKSGEKTGERPTGEGRVTELRFELEGAANGGPHVVRPLFGELQVLARLKPEVLTAE